MGDLEFSEDDYLVNEVMGEIGRLNELVDGSEEHSRATSDVVKLHTQLLEEWKFAANTEKETRTLDQAEEKLALEREKFEFEKEQAKSQKRFKIGEFVSRVAVDVAAVVVPACIYNTWMKRGFEFEKTGTFTSTTFRNLTSKFKPTKR